MVTLEVLVHVEGLRSDQLTREERTILNEEAEGAAIEMLHKKLGRRMGPGDPQIARAKALKNDWSWIERPSRADVSFTMPGWKRRLQDRERE